MSSLVVDTQASVPKGQATGTMVGQGDGGGPGSVSGGVAGNSVAFNQVLAVGNQVVGGPPAGGAAGGVAGGTGAVAAPQAVAHAPVVNNQAPPAPLQPAGRVAGVRCAAARRNARSGVARRMYSNRRNPRTTCFALPPLNGGQDHRMTQGVVPLEASRISFSTGLGRAHPTVVTSPRAGFVNLVGPITGGSSDESESEYDAPWYPSNW